MHDMVESIQRSLGTINSANFLNIAGASTNTIKRGAGTLVRVIINKAVATGVITMYDSLAASGTLIATITSPVALLQSQVPLDYNLAFANGLTVVTSAADDITVIYR